MKADWTGCHEAVMRVGGGRGSRKIVISNDTIDNISSVLIFKIYKISLNSLSNVSNSFSSIFFVSTAGRG